MFKLYKLLPVVMLGFLALPGPALADSTLAVVTLHNQQKAGNQTLAVLKEEDGAFQKNRAKPGQPPLPLVFKDSIGPEPPSGYHYQVRVVPDGSKEASVIASLNTASNARWFVPTVTKCEAKIKKGTSCTVEARKEGQARCHMILKCPGKNPAATTD